MPPGTVDPVPPPGLNARGGRPCRGVPRPECDGDGVFLSIVDTGLMPDAAAGHPWLTGVQGTAENPYTTQGDGSTIIVPYAGHGTFVAGVARCMAPKASAYVERAFDIAGANYETMLPASLEDALNRNPDILVFTFCTTTRRDQSLITFDDFFDTRIRYLKGLVVLAPAGNDGHKRRTWPAAYREVLSVGALSANGRDRAHFSNYGKWVDVFAPGQDLINAFPVGYLRVHRASGRGAPEVPRDGQVERDVVLHSRRRRVDRGPDVLDGGERAAGGGFAAAAGRQPGDPRSRRGALPRPGLLRGLRLRALAGASGRRRSGGPE